MTVEQSWAGIIGEEFGFDDAARRYDYHIFENSACRPVGNTFKLKRMAMEMDGMSFVALIIEFQSIAFI
jgi:hypothetical protein